jgi:hypothetical protein
MLGVTIFGIFLTPVFDHVIRRLDERKAPPHDTEQVPVAGPLPEPGE